MVHLSNTPVHFVSVMFTICLSIPEVPVHWKPTATAAGKLVRGLYAMTNHTPSRHMDTCLADAQYVNPKSEGASELVTDIDCVGRTIIHRTRMPSWAARWILLQAHYGVDVACYKQVHKLEDDAKRVNLVVLKDPDSDVSDDEMAVYGDYIRFVPEWGVLRPFALDGLHDDMFSTIQARLKFLKTVDGSADRIEFLELLKRAAAVSDHPDFLDLATAIVSLLSGWHATVASSNLARLCEVCCQDVSFANLRKVNAVCRSTPPPRTTRSMLP